MKIDALTGAYLAKAQVRFKALKFYYDEGAYSDVVREAQEMVELLLKAVLRTVGVEMPKVHDVGRVLEQHSSVLPPPLPEYIHEVKRISKRLRKERELSFYGAEDFIPTEEYGPEDAQQAMEEAHFILTVVKEALEKSDK